LHRIFRKRFERERKRKKEEGALRVGELQDASRCAFYTLNGFARSTNSVQNPSYPEQTNIKCSREEGEKKIKKTDAAGAQLR